MNLVLIKTIRKESGSALIAALMLIMIASGIVALAVATTSHTARLASRTRSLETGVAIGDAYLDCAYAQWRAACQQSNAILSGSNFTADKMTPPGASFLAQSGSFTVTNFRIRALQEINSQTNNNANVWGDGAPIAIQQSPDGNDNSYLYLATADVSVPGLGGTPITSRVRRFFEKRVESPWNYAIFFNDLLEMHPGAAFVVNGWVHGNGDIYAITGAGNLTTNTLTFKDKLTYTSNYYESFANGDAQTRKDPNSPAPGRYYTGPDDLAIKLLKKPDYNSSPASVNRKDPLGISPLQFDTTDTNPNNDSYRELIERPDSGFSDPLGPDSQNPRFYYQAGLKILVNGGTVTIYAKDGTQITSSNPTYTAVTAAITTGGQSITDNREGGAAVGITTIDVSLLDPKKINGWNGIVYISDLSASKTAKRGVRLKNGSALPTGGLTVVSDNPVYIQGDYNTAKNQWQPAAVVADAVNILSNNWKDTNAATTSSRVASNTTINTAILSGIVPTTANPNTYSGGVENFPRFLENWGGITLTYNGSMVELFNSQQATGTWGKSNVYSPPTRVWAFDTRLRTSPPPGIFQVISYSRCRWYME